MILFLIFLLVQHTSFPGEIQVVQSSFSPSGRLLGLIRRSEKDNKIKHFVEVWKQNSIIVSLETTDLHDDVYVDGSWKPPLSTSC